MKNKTLIVIAVGAVIALVVLGALSFYAWKFYNERFRDVPTETVVEDILSFENVKQTDMILYSEFSDEKKTHIWRNSKLTSLSDLKTYDLNLPKDTYSFEKPQIANDRMYYYTTGDDPENDSSRNLTLWNSDIYGDDERKIVSSKNEYNIKDILISPDGKYLVYFRFINENKKISCWIFDIEQEYSRELIPPTNKMAYEGYKGWSGDSSRFYLVMKEKDKQNLMEVEIDGTKILGSFPELDFTKVKSYKASSLFVDPNGEYIYQLDAKKDKSVLTRINVDNSEENEVASPEGEISKTNLSPDGKKFAFRLKPAGKKNQEIYIVNSDGSDLKKAAESGDEKESLSDIMFLQNDNNLAFTRKIYGNYSKIVYLDTGNLDEKVLIEDKVENKEKSSYLRLVSYAKLSSLVNLERLENDPEKQKNLE